MNTTNIIVTILALSSIWVSARDIDTTKYSAKLRRFITDVIFEVEAGDREKYSKKLPSVVSVSYHCNPAQQQLAESKLNEFLEATGVKIGTEPKKGELLTKIDIYLGKREALQPLAYDKDKEISLDRGCAYWNWWNNDRVITESVIFICTDRLNGRELESKLVEQLFGTFGLPNKSKETDSSCLAMKDQEYTSLQPIDLKVLNFYYRAVPAGTKPREVDKIIRAQWK